MISIPVVWLGAAQAQEFKSPIWGGSGGTSSYNLDCGSSGVMVGFYGKTGMWVDQIGVTCQVVNSDGTLGATYTRGPVGGSGGTTASARCTSGMVVGQLLGIGGSYINSVYFQCAIWMPGTRRLNWSGTIQSKALGTEVGTGSVRCPPEKVGKAIRGKSGGYIDSLQFVCDDYNK